MNSCHYVLSAKMPKFIPVADKPLNLGGKIECLAIEEFQQRFGCVYNDGISIQTKVIPFNENIIGETSASQLKKQVKKVLKEGCKNLVICNMGKCGHGVFASQDIPKNTVVALYSGTIIIENEISEKDHAHEYYGTAMSSSTKYHRGIASFMQHLPEEALKLGTEIRSLVATENIRKEYLSFKNIPVIAMVTDKDIQSGDQLGFNYGDEYWSSRNITPEFFDKNGNVWPHKV